MKNIPNTWSTTHGFMVKDWSSNAHTSQIQVASPGDKIYWTFLEPPKGDEPIFVNFVAKPKDSNEAAIQSLLRLDWDESTHMVVVEKEN